ncbi:MAG: DUF4199 domain-containing protein [Bacteroidia bacterium]|nr:DUF4199 domain-containing protein [Bacteroidia bacterium]
MKKKVILYGSIAGFIVVAIMFVSGFFIGENMAAGQALGYLSMFISLSTIPLAIHEIRKENGNGPFSFWSGFRVGLLITLIASVIYVMGWMFYSEQYAPDFEEKYGQAQIEAKIAEGASEAEIDQLKVEVGKTIALLKNPFIKILVTFSEIFPVGLLVSLLGALFFMRRKELTP